MTQSLLTNPVQIGDGTSWLFDPRTWNTFTAGGLDWVGSFRIRNHKRKYKLDTKNAAGLEGATNTYRGFHVEHFDVTFDIWTDAQWTYWKTFSALFQYSASKIGQDVFPIAVYHPSLAEVGIKAVICLSYGGVDVDPNSLMGQAKLVLKEYLPPLPANATQTPSGASTSLQIPTTTIGVNPTIAGLEVRLETAQSNLAAAQGRPGALP